ncbi:MAG: GerMN domain-containing protein [Halanaerobium sp.]|nr:GerMN domain-containing protein [Halanaerobium sp.]
MNWNEHWAKIKTKVPFRNIIYIILAAVIFLSFWFWYRAEYIQIEVYFSTKDAKHLVPEVRKVALADKYYQAVQELIKGPRKEGLIRTIPAGTRVLAVEVRERTAYLNMSRELQERHWGGSAGEIFTVYSLVNTLSRFPEVDRVQLLLEGEEVSSLVGHLELDQPLEPDYSLLKDSQSTEEDEKDVDSRQAEDTELTGI